MLVGGKQTSSNFGLAVEVGIRKMGKIKFSFSKKGKIKNNRGKDENLLFRPSFSHLKIVDDFEHF